MINPRYLTIDIQGFIEREGATSVKEETDKGSSEDSDEGVDSQNSKRERQSSV